MNYVQLNKIIFKGKQNIQWNDVERFLKRYLGHTYVVKEYGDLIRVNYVFADEYTESKYTKKLRGALAKVKANIVQVLPQLIENGTNRRWEENKNQKHNGNAVNGWYRYDTFFAVSVRDEKEPDFRWNYYKGTLLVRINDNGLFLYDIINIKKETSTPRES